jgi:hypothetical protein
MEYEVEYLTAAGHTEARSREVQADLVAIVALKEKLAREVAQEENA